MKSSLELQHRSAPNVAHFVGGGCPIGSSHGKTLNGGVFLHLCFVSKHVYHKDHARLPRGSQSWGDGYGEKGL